MVESILEDLSGVYNILSYLYRSFSLLFILIKSYITSYLELSLLVGSKVSSTSLARSYTLSIPPTIRDSPRASLLVNLVSLIYLLRPYRIELTLYLSSKIISYRFYSSSILIYLSS